MDEVYNGFIVFFTSGKKNFIYFLFVVFCTHVLQTSASRFTP